MPTDQSPSSPSLPIPELSDEAFGREPPHSSKGMMRQLLGTLGSIGTLAQGVAITAILFPPSAPPQQLPPIAVYPFLTYAISTLAVMLFLAGCAFRRRRSLAWGLLGLFSLIGIYIVINLSDKPPRPKPTPRPRN